MRSTMEMIGHVDKPWLRHPPSWHFTLGSLLLAMILFSTIPAATSQIIGVDICACSPSVYTFQLNFSFTCNEQTVSDNPGVKDEDCFVQGLRQQDGVTDFVPNKVSTFEILELDANQNIIQSGYYQQGYFDGAKISYTSITGKPDAVQNLTVDQLPRGLQINIIAQNANEEDIINTWIVLFTNMCNAFPVFEVGDQDGWTLILGLENPLGFFCPPASPAPSTSAAPSVTPEPSRSLHPSVSSYPSPTGPPVPPVESEKPSAVSLPTCSPSYSPISPSSKNQFLAPTLNPTPGRGKGKGKGMTMGKGMGGMLSKAPKKDMANMGKGKGKGVGWAGLAELYSWDDYMSFPPGSSKSKGGPKKSKYSYKSKWGSSHKRPPQDLCKEKSYKKKSFKSSKQSAKIKAPIGKVKSPKYKKKLPTKSKAQAKINKPSFKAKGSVKVKVSAKAKASAKVKTKASKSLVSPKSKAVPSKSKGASSKSTSTKSAKSPSSSKQGADAPTAKPVMPSSKVAVVPSQAPGPQSEAPNLSKRPSQSSSPLAPAGPTVSPAPASLTNTIRPSLRPSPSNSSGDSASQS